MIIKPLHGAISLTEEGYKQAKAIECKNKLLKKMLISLQVDKKTAEMDACRIEHVVSNETMLHLFQFFSKEQSQDRQI